MKKIKYIIFFAVILLTDNIAFAQKCDCSTAFKWMKTAFEENDAGFRYILDQKGYAAYETHNKLFENKVGEITEPDSCVSAIRQWAKFFRVGHFGFIVNQVHIKKNKDSENKSVGPSKNKINNIHLDSEPYVQEYDSTTVYLRIATFESQYKKTIDSVIHANSELIYTRKNLIIDIRDNGGGDDASFDEILPIVYTNPIRDVSVARLSTPHNNKIWEDYMSQNSVSASDKAVYAGYLKKLNANLGRFVMLHDSVRTFRYQKVTQFPQNVAIMINGNNGSTAEQFLLAARQSKKVKLFGTTTMGELDISNMYYITSPDGKYTLWYCTSKSLRIPENSIDNKGISPDFYLDKSIPKNQWLPYVAGIMRYW
ncbi:peptidase S41-like protein [Mucilaginibacter frigoritolerans]|uniref:Peptidase S41-like protein n=1 Tax=Mucilaginibacter frigoritolerans TaxID=652788 RepID=A0A562TM02_9SPHI|nr:S41 family peptidase [Mucilaginibacter frigoritolerans]TWI94575.1 peptidase S41-like protein [Mucilaginibacter frigoritolerans]